MISVQERHADHVHFQDPVESVPISVVYPNANEYILDHTEFVLNTKSDRHMMSIK